MVYIICCLLGLGTLLPFNVLITEQQFFSVRTHVPPTTLAFADNITNLIVVSFQLVCVPSKCCACCSATCALCRSADLLVHSLRTLTSQRHPLGLSDIQVLYTWQWLLKNLLYFLCNLVRLSGVPRHPGFSPLCHARVFERPPSMCGDEHDKHHILYPLSKP